VTTTNDPAAIAKSLRRYEPLRALVKTVGPPPVQRRAPVGSRYTYLVRSVVYQQLAGAAASAIYGRLAAACGDRVLPDAVDALSDDQLISFGLSGAKRAAIRDLTNHVDERTVRLDRHAHWDDEEVMADLVKVRGIGPWTVQMYQMSSLGRPDVWPTGDYGVRNGWSLLHNLEPMITPKILELAAEPLAGHRSAVAWYCWEAVRLQRAPAR
jgi:3-methyladenine DNA glycosylase/8-oxoguanine DNA glycosylase